MCYVYSHRKSNCAKNGEKEAQERMEFTTFHKWTRDGEAGALVVWVWLFLFLQGTRITRVTKTIYPLGSTLTCVIFYAWMGKKFGSKFCVFWFSCFPPSDTKED